MKNTIDKKVILNNRLEFITHHRDSRESLDGLELFHSTEAYFKTAFLFNPGKINSVPIKFELYIPDWIDFDKKALSENGWQETDPMIYMVLNSNKIKWKINEEVKIKRITKKADLETFCKTQSKGFNGGKIQDDPWYPIMLKSSLRNYRKNNHHFYLASLNGEPAGATVLFFHHNCMGIYSVTTIEKFRKNGVSTSLMKKAVMEGLAAKVKYITLQTMDGTYAQSFYEKLGFEALFANRVFKQKNK